MGTFTVVGTLADFGTQPRAGVRVRANATPTVKVAGTTVYSDATETALTDAAGAFTLTLTSLVGVWYTIRSDYGETNPVTLAGYVPDQVDPTTGVVLGNGTVIQLATVTSEAPTPGYAIAVGPTGATGLTGPRGPAGQDGENGQDGEPSQYELRGTGSPEGVRTAAVGTYYTDTAGTMGAWRWLKQSGAGSTGWVVEVGDTGWRDVPQSAGSLTNHPQLTVRLRRVGPLVTLAVSEAVAAAAGTGLTSIYTLTPYPGFSLAAGLYATGPLVVMTSGALATPGALYIGGQSGVNLYRSGAVRHGGSVTWATADTWPATLPGTAA